MLKRIRCDAFAEQYRDIVFNNNLNTILGDKYGSSAIGKTTYLDVIDYVFGGDHYYSGDIQQNVGFHTIYFEFEFEQESLYFYRETAKPNFVIRCDNQWHFREELEMRHYRRLLAEKYNSLSGSFGFEDVIAHFFRIYGHGNTVEQLPIISSVHDTQGKAIDFLMNLFGKANILDSLAQRAKELGISAGQVYKKSDDKSTEDEEQIEINNAQIEALNERYTELMSDSADYQFDYLGFSKEVTDKLHELKQKTQTLIAERDVYQAQIDAIHGVRRNELSEITGEFDSLTRFFPGANVKALADIEHFHSRIREILAQEAQEQIFAIQREIGFCNTGIARLKKRIKDVGLTRKMATGAVTQGVEIKMQIEHLVTENEEISKRIEGREARRRAEQELAELILKQQMAINSVQQSINETMHVLSDVITDKRESYAPQLFITDEKKATFETPGNTSESSAFKGLIIYDLAIMRLCPGRLPALIHDSNILSRVESEYLAPILQQYIECGHQVFIAFENPEAANNKTKELLYSHVRLCLGAGGGRELYGRSWSKRVNIDPAIDKGIAKKDEGDEDNGSDT